MCACRADWCGAASNNHSRYTEKSLTLQHPMLELPMAVVHHHDLPAHETNRCATMFCLTWLGFFALLGVATYLISLL
jgi:hypothetical protein